MLILTLVVHTTQQARLPCPRLTRGSFPLLSHINKLYLMMFRPTASLVGAQHEWETVENKTASALFASLGKAHNGMPPSLCGRQVVGPKSYPSSLSNLIKEIADVAQA